MILRDTLSTFLNTYMGVDENTPRIDPYLANGLQVAGAEEIHTIATGVSANLAFFEKAKEAGAQALLVHHALVPPATLLFEQDIAFMKRLKYLWQQNLSLFGFHYLLDSHPKVGNNARVIEQLGGTLLEPYGKDGWGWIGDIPGGIDLAKAITICQDLFQGNGYYYPVGKKTVHKVVALSGSGAPRSDDYVWLAENEIDLFVTGEPREWTQELCRETGISFVAGGHYNSERLGVQALGAVIKNEFEVEVIFIDVPNLA